MIRNAQNGVRITLFSKRINWFRVMLVGLVCAVVCYITLSSPYASPSPLRQPWVYCLLGSLYIGAKQKESPVLHGALVGFFMGLFFSLFFWTWFYEILARYCFTTTLKSYLYGIVKTSFTFVPLGMLGGYVGSRLWKGGSVKFEKS